MQAVLGPIDPRCDAAILGGQCCRISRQKGFDLGAGRCPSRAANARAFNSSDRRAKAHGFDLVSAFRERHYETAVKSIPRPERIDGGDFEHRQAAHSAAIEINDIVRSIADRKERVGLAGDTL